MSPKLTVLPLLCALVLIACIDRRSDTGVVGSGPVPSRQCSNFNALRQPFFGDLHVHTKYSLDANTQGTVITPHDAYRFAMGEQLGIQPHNEAGEPLRFTRISRPLDFAAVTDHAELFGETEICTNPAYLEYNTPECIFYRNFPDQSFILFNLVAVGLPELPQFPVPPWRAGGVGRACNRQQRLDTALALLRREW